MSTAKLSKTLHKIVVKELGTDFSKVTQIVEAPIPTPGPGEVLVRNRFVGINASDVNYSAGYYDPKLKPPFDCGMEGLGLVAAVGEEVKMKVGQPVVYLQGGAFSTYKIVSKNQLVPLPDLNPCYLPFILSGLTAVISLDKVAEVKQNDKVLITAAAGGTGQFAVQWCKNAGCHVIGTCSSDDKIAFLKSIGCDRPINYKKEDLNAVLKAEYPKGVDVVYESVGGATFETCVNNLARFGRLTVIGAISGYTSGFSSGFQSTSALPLKLLQLSASIRGFFLPHYSNCFEEYMTHLITLYKQGKIKSEVDLGEKSSGGTFKGLHRVIDAIQHMYSGKNIGKVIVELPE